MPDEDYEFANAAPWEQAGRTRKKAPAPRIAQATILRPPPHVRQHLTDQLVALASITAASTKDGPRSAPQSVADLPPYPVFTNSPDFITPAESQFTNGDPNATDNEVGEPASVHNAFNAPVFETNYIYKAYAGDDTDSDESKDFYGYRPMARRPSLPLIPPSEETEVFTSTGDAGSVQIGFAQTGSEYNSPMILNQSHPTQTQEDGVWVTPIRGVDDNMFPDVYPTGFRRANDGSWRERQGAPPDDTFDLPRARHSEFDAFFFGPSMINLSHIARKTNTHISIPDDFRKPTLLMWGSKEAIAAAKKDLLHLKSQVEDDLDAKVRRVGGWARIKAAPTDRMQQHYNNIIHAAKIRRKLRLLPQDGTIFPASGVFYWPVTEITPQSVLGNGFEALDSIRYDNECFILYNRKQKMFKILGDNQGNVDNAVDRVFGVLCEVAAKQRRCNKMILVEPPSHGLPGTVVMMEFQHDLMDVHTTVPHHVNHGIQLKLGGRSPPVLFLRQWQHQRESLWAENSNYMHAVIQQGLHDVAYYRGYVKLRFYIGKLVMFGYKRSVTNEYPLHQYMEDVRAPQSDGEVIRSIRRLDEDVSDDEVATTLLTKCEFQNALATDEKVFRPIDINMDTKLLEQGAIKIEPQYSATFEIRLYDSSGRSNGVRFEVIFSRDSDTLNYRIAEYRWLKSIAKCSTQEYYPLNNRKGPVITKVQDLEADLAYEMELSTWDIFPDSDEYPVFDKFLQSVRVEDIPDENDILPPPELGQHDTRRRIKRVVFKQTPGMNVTGLTQKTKWRYWIHKSHYYMELTRYEYLPVKALEGVFLANMQVTWQDIKVGVDTRWAVTVGNQDWDDSFRKQMDVKLGCSGDWNTDINAFFKCSGEPTIHGGLPSWSQNDGFGECLGRVNEVKNFVKSCMDEVARRKKLNAGEDNTGLVTWAGLPEYDA